MTYKSFGNGKNLVCLHPIGLSGSIWEEFVSSLGNYFTVIAIDLPGHGNSAPLNSVWSISTMADAVFEDLATISNDYSLLGASLGGMVAQEIAVRKPERLTNLILVDTLCTLTKEQRIAIEARAEKTSKEGMASILDDTITRWFTTKFIHEKAEVVNKIKIYLSNCDSEIHSKCWNAISQFDLENEIRTIEIPVCAIVGSDDVSTPPYMAEKISRNVVKGKTIIIPEAAHMSMIEKPDLFTNVVKNFYMKN